MKGEFAMEIEIKEMTVTDQADLCIPGVGLGCIGLGLVCIGGGLVCGVLC